MIETFENRFEVGYLELLSRKLEIEDLKKSAIEVEPEDWKVYHSKRSNEDITLTKVIRIDFCGFAGTTLLGTNLEEQKNDIREIFPEEADQIIHLRDDVARKFKRLFNDDVIEDFNESGRFLQVRFCFPYLYSDNVISFMKAENSDFWLRKDHEISFEGNAPVSPTEWQLSNYFKSQFDSLEEIVRICKDHPSFAKLTEYDAAINKIETRFAVIPIPICLMVINDIAISDCYVYAKLIRKDHLAINTPVNVVHRFNKIENAANQKEHSSYKILRQNYLYIWTHDMTMYADMCTDFSEDDPGGLVRIKQPIKPGKKSESNIDWKIKINRMKKRKKDLNSDYESNSERKEIEAWEENVINKMELCTRKIQRKKIEIDPRNLFISISKPSLDFCLSIKHYDVEIFRYAKKTSILFFCAVAHFSHALKLGVDQQFQKNYKNKTNFKKGCKKEIAGEERIKHKLIDADTIFKSLFYIPDDEQKKWVLRVPASNITIENIERIIKAEYKVGNSKTPCFEGLKLSDV